MAKLLIGFIFTLCVLARFGALLVFDIPFLAGCDISSDPCDLTNPLCFCPLKDALHFKGKDLLGYFEVDTIFSNSNHRYGLLPQNSYHKNVISLILCYVRNIAATLHYIR